MRLQDKVTLITGGAAGIGKAAAQRFLEEGSKVELCDVNQEAGESVVEEWGPGVAFRQVNVTDREQVRAWVSHVLSVHNRVDVLINNAGIIRDGLLVKMKDGELKKEMPETDFDLVVAARRFDQSLATMQCKR